jgi:hypothetical protein
MTEQINGPRHWFDRLTQAGILVILAGITFEVFFQLGQFAAGSGVLKQVTKPLLDWAIGRIMGGN